jgi:Domain of unknown function (DUF397)
VGKGSTWEQPVWHARHCENGACVEVAVQGESVMVRSSVAPEAILTLARAEWDAFLTGARDGLFDDL